MHYSFVRHNENTRARPGGKKERVTFAEKEGGGNHDRKDRVGWRGLGLGLESDRRWVEMLILTGARLRNLVDN